MMKPIQLIMLLLIVAFLVLYFLGDYRWQGTTRALHTKMNSVGLSSGIETYDPSELAGLPAPVQRYFQSVLKDGQLLVTSVSVEHTGTFNMGETTERWRPFSSKQRVVTQRPGFVWDARIRMAPGMTVRVHDAFVAGRGYMTAKLFGLFTVMNQPNTPELAHGELMRYFAEAAWYPTALLPSQGVIWKAIDDTRASAMLTDGTTTVNLVFQFDAEGLISAIHSDGRYREVDGVQVPTPWQGRFWDYQIRDGMLIPLEGEVAWLLTDGMKPYWRGRIQRVQYEMSGKY
jgi:hypothetical protein